MQLVYLSQRDAGCFIDPQHLIDEVPALRRQLCTTPTSCQGLLSRAAAQCIVKLATLSVLCHDPI